MRIVPKILTVTTIATLMVGCTPEVSEEVVTYVDTVKNRKSVYKGDLPKFPKPITLEYTANNLRDPFIPYFLGTEDTRKTPAGGPDLNRKREPLEAYPLDSLTMVGTIEKNGVYYALLRDSSGGIHRVGVGNYIGQNAGRIEQISDDEIRIKQWLSDNKGGWREFPVSIYLTKARARRGPDEMPGGR